ncbi:MAG: RsiV family protein [Burkholderiaceae bacterium]
MPFRLLARVAAPISLALLAACASPSDRNITLAGPDASARASGSSAASVDESGVAVRPIKYARQKPGCSGTCPRIEVDSIAIESAPKLTQLIDNALAYMTGVDPDRSGNYRSLQEYEQHFWATAQARDVTQLRARVRDAYKGLITVELTTGQYLTGAAHGIPATQFLNWERDRNRVLALNEALVPGRQDQFNAALQRAHGRWKTQLEDYQRDPGAFDRMWPFQPTDNFALTRTGVVMKYDAYAIAPYASGQPEVVIPYSELTGVLDPKWLPG